MRRLVIKGSEWERGKEHGDAALYLPHAGTYCCLGIHGRACGLSDDVMAGKGEPEELEIPVEEIPKDYRKAWLREADGYVQSDERVSDAIAANDNRYITDEERIERLRPVFREVGVTLVWRPDL